MRAARILPTLAASAALSSGCIKSMLIDGQIEGTRQASVAFDTLGDWELAYQAASSGLVQFEGMHVLAPDNTDALFLLTKGWTGFAFGFAEDDMEVAEDDGARERAEHHKRRALAGYDRAIEYGLALLAHQAKGFEDARGSEATLETWLRSSFTAPEDAENLFWTGYAWMARTNLVKDDAEAIANIFVPVKLLEHSVALDPGYNHGLGTVVLASYHARTAMAELDQAKELFDAALEKTQRKLLVVQLNYATKYACAKADAVLYTKLLNEVLAAEDSQPELRLMNTIAKRRAKRWLSPQRMFDACSMDPPAASIPEEKSNAS